MKKLESLKLKKFKMQSVTGGNLTIEPGTYGAEATYRGGIYYTDMVSRD
ncbi:hypothetical protein [Epilithonimonas sp.]|nr:hypothetical protein [Epilithonimonas sp.]